MAAVRSAAAFWRSTRLADVTIIHISAAGEAADAADAVEVPPSKRTRRQVAAAEVAEAQSRGVRLPGHKFLLAMTSAYFCTRLETAVAGATSTDAAGHLQLVVELEDEEHVAAAEAALELMYTEQVPKAW